MRRVQPKGSAKYSEVREMNTSFWRKKTHHERMRGCWKIIKGNVWMRWFNSLQWKQQTEFTISWCFTWKDAELKTYRPRFAESEDGSALQSRHHGHQRVEVVQFQQFLHTNKHLLFYYCYITGYTLDLFLLRDLTFAIFTKWLSISARIFSFWAVKISRTSQKLTCNSTFRRHSKRSLFIMQPKNFIILSVPKMMR